MARDGSGNYHRPPGTDGAPDTTIESAKYNGFVADVEQDLNTPRPVIAGGTGANNARDAMITLGGELANQYVTNYDTHPFVSGSFSSQGSATAGPGPGLAVTGTCVIHIDPLYATLRAHEVGSAANPGKSYIREKKAGAWLPWKSDGTTQVGDAEGVGSEAGDMFFGIKGTAPSSSFVVNTESDLTGTNTLAVDKAGNVAVYGMPSSYANLVLNSGAGSATIAAIIGNRAGVGGRWQIVMGDGTPEAAGNAGADFTLNRFSNAGAYLSTPLIISRNSGIATFGSGVSTPTATVSGNISASTISITSGNFQIGAASTGYYGDGSNLAIRTYNQANTSKIYFQSAGGTLTMGTVDPGGWSLMVPLTNSARVQGADLMTTSGNLYFNSTGSFQMSCDGVRINTPNSFTVGNVFTVNGAMIAGPSGIQVHGGLTFASGQLLPLATSGALQTGGAGGLEVKSDGASDAWMTFHRPANFATHFGLCNDHNLYFGGYSHGAQFKIWTTRELTAVIASIRTVFAGDFEHVYQNGMQEPYRVEGGESFVTGCQQGNGIATFRYRTLQMLQNGAWVQIQGT